MTQRKPTSYAGRHTDGDHHKLSTEYNLEVEPLQTGNRQPRGPWLNGLRRTSSTELHHRSWLGMALWLILLTVGVGMLAVVLTGWAVVTYFYG